MTHITLQTLEELQSQQCYILYSDGLTSIFERYDLLAFAASLFAFFSIWLRSGLLSERIRGDVYADERPAHAIM